MSSRGGLRRGGALGWVVLAVCMVALLAAAALFERARRLEARRLGSLTSVTVETDPSAAEVWLDGRFVGLSPATVNGLGVGEHLIEARCGGYLPQTERRTVGAAGEQLRLVLKKQATGSISIRSEPEGAEALLDGQSRGNTPLEIHDLVPGTYRLVIHKAGRDYWSQPVTVQADKTTQVSAELQDHVLTFLLAAVKDDPKKLATWTELGHYYGVRDREDESIAAFAKGLELCVQDGVDGNDVNRYFQMLNRQMNWPGRDRTRYSKKITDAFLAIARDNADKPGAITRLANILEQQRRFDEALDLYVMACKKSTQVDPKLVEQGFALGVRQGKIDAARELAAAACKNRPADGSLRVVLGSQCLAGYARLDAKSQEAVLTLAEGLYAEAARLLAERPARAQAIYGQARAQSFGNKKAEAAATYARAADELVSGGKGDRTKWAEWLFESAELLAKLDRTEESRATLNRIVKEGPEGAIRSRAQKELARLAPPPPPAPPSPPPAPQIQPAQPPAPSPAPGATQNQ